MTDDPNQLPYEAPPDTGPARLYPPDSGGALLAVLRFIGWRMLTAGVIAMLVAAIWFAISPVLAVLSPVLIIIFFPELAGVSSRVRRQRATVILTYLEQAARLNLPLPRMLDAAQRSEERRTADRLRRVRDLLEDGAPLDAALRLGAPEVSARAVGLVAAAERIGRLPHALARLVEEDRDAHEDPERGAFARWYPLMMFLCMSVLISMILIFVMPKMQQIYADFGLRLPAATRHAIELARATMSGDVPWFLFLLLAVAIIILGGAFERIFSPPQQVYRPHWTDYVLWSLPFAHGAARDRGMADACQTIASALRSGRPLESAIAQVGELRINAVLRGRFLRWQSLLASGEPAPQAARRAKLPELLAGMISPARGAGLPDAMDFLAAYYAGKFSRLREFLHGAAIPVIVLCFAGLVLFIVAAMYLPIIGLMDNLSANPLTPPR